MAARDAAATSPEPTAPSRLERLPVELLRLVCTQFCRHCSGGPGLDTQYERDRLSRETLTALCQTSRTLCLVAQPILCHAPDICRPGRFVRTMVRHRPDLAVHVRCLPFSQRWTWRWPYGARMRRRDASLVTRLGDGLHMRLARTGAGDFICTHPRLPWFFKAGPARAEEYYAELLIALLPRLELINLNIHEGVSSGCFGACYSVFWNLEDRYSQPGPASLLPWLRTVVINANERFGCFPLSIGGVVALLGAAPNLRELTLRFVAGIDRQIMLQEDMDTLSSALQKVTHVTFDEYALNEEREPEYSYIRELVQLCASLEVFILRVEPQREAELEDRYYLSPTRLLEALLSAKQSLRSFTLRVRGVLVNTDDLRPSLRPMLQQFPLLTTLVLDEQAFCRHWLPPEAGGCTESEAACITGFLPQTVTTLSVRLHEQFRAHNDVLHLGHRVVAGEFPSLRYVYVEKLDEYEERDYKNPRPFIDRNPEIVEAHRISLRRAFEGTVVHTDATRVWDLVGHT